MVEDLPQRVGGIDAQSVDAGHFQRVFFRQDQVPKAVLRRRDRHAQSAAHRHQPSLQGKLSQKNRRVQFPKRVRQLGRKQRHGNGQLEGGALFAHIGRGQVHRHLTARKGQVADGNSRTDAVTAFLDGGAGKADDLKPHHSPGNIGFHFYRKSVDPIQTAGVGFRQHGHPAFLFIGKRSIVKIEPSAPVELGDPLHAVQPLGAGQPA